MLFWRLCFHFRPFFCCLSCAFLPSKEQLPDWLQKRDSHPIVELSYLEVGLGSQTIHMQFGEGGAAYTLLVMDSLRCKRFFGLLTGTFILFGSFRSGSDRYQDNRFPSPLNGGTLRPRAVRSARSSVY